MQEAGDAPGRAPHTLQSTPDSKWWVSSSVPLFPSCFLSESGGAGRLSSLKSPIKDLEPGSLCQCRRTGVARAGAEPAAGAPGSRARPVCVLDADCIPLKFLGQGARCAGCILTAITASQLSLSPYPDPTFPIGTLNVPPGELDFQL